ncbi:hypothetical protein ONZ43_g5543 [Nemania bipapillata]|uniref:Uncharacterized protein n=1 Tax=Nemania bipapillata TaxID=110536 RepID=A0ACC2I9E3_9PEZI|nr:hypothetical protein ONZ43_g5543 [Nemania bipapillata]
MSSATNPEKQHNGIPKPGALECHLPHRSNSLPLLKAGIERPLMLDVKPMRSVSLAPKGRKLRARHQGRSRFVNAFKPAPVTQESNGVPLDRDSYDSDEEDRRSGVSIIYSQGQYVPFQASMKRELEAEFLRLKLYGEELSTTLDEWKQAYEQLFVRISKASARHRTASQWEDLFFLEDTYLNVREELSMVQDAMGRVHAQMRLFLDHTPPPSSHRDWRQDGDSTVWVPEAVAKQQAKRGEYPILEWNGVDYNATSQFFEI